MKNISKKFYPKLALINIKKNGKFYYPYLLTCLFTVAMFYIMCFLVFNPGLDNISGGTNMKNIIAFGCGVVGVFSFIFLIYTNSYLMKRRKKEFGMYNILGMEKKHIGKVMIFETIYTALGTIAAGVICGIVFSKLVLLALGKMLNFEAKVEFIVSWLGIAVTGILFIGIFFVILIGNLISVGRSNPIELLHGTNSGEKEPKTKLIIALVGAVTLAAGYYLAITTKSPLSAMQYFFVAVILVIVGTYCLFIAGSIAILKILRKNKKYYYKTSHFTTVSGMLYRMKKNAAGLASICILSTMVLVVVSTTVSMYIGVDDALEYRYPNDISIENEYLYSKRDNMDENNKKILDEVNKVIEKEDVKADKIFDYTTLAVIASKIDNNYSFERYFYNGSSTVHIFEMITEQDYEKITGKKIDLAEDEVLEYSSGKKLPSEFKLGNVNLKVKNSVEKFEIGSDYTAYIAEIHMLVVSDIQVLNNIYEDRCEILGTNETNEDKEVNNICYKVKMDLDEKNDKIIKCYDEMSEIGTYTECRQATRDEFYMLYGGLLFVGIFLGLLFLIITVLIIYYKQITEGYEDKQRFKIMQKVGMSRTEVRKSIKSQILTVFMLPIIVAGAHVAGSFKMITKLLALLNLTNESLFKTCTLITIGIFVIVYGIVYFLTSKVYYNIVES